MNGKSPSFRHPVLSLSSCFFSVILSKSKASFAFAQDLVLQLFTQELRLRYSPRKQGEPRFLLSKTAEAAFFSDLTNCSFLISNFLIALAPFLTTNN